MDWRNRIGLYETYFFGVAGIGFTLPYLPLYLGQQGLADRTIGWISTLAALAGLAQYPVGVLSDRIGRRKPFLLGAVRVGRRGAPEATQRTAHRWHPAPNPHLNPPPQGGRRPEMRTPACGCATKIGAGCVSKARSQERLFITPGPPR
jgi:hypothetical protein